MTLKELQTKRDQILKLAQRHGAKDIRSFGSVAQGEESSKSDIDFLIKLELGRSLLDLIAFKQDLEELLGTKIDVVTERALSPYLKDEILKTAVNL